MRPDPSRMVGWLRLSDQALRREGSRMKRSRDGACGWLALDRAQQVRHTPRARGEEEDEKCAKNTHTH